MPKGYGPRVIISKDRVCCCNCKHGEKQGQTLRYKCRLRKSSFRDYGQSRTIKCGRFESIYDGYPIKCNFCESKNLNWKYSYEGENPTEIIVRCNDCGKEVGNLAHGTWRYD